MIDCENAELRDQLPDYLHGSLDTRARAVVAAHLARCADCRAELALLGDARGVLASAPPVDVGRIVAALPRPAARRPMLGAIPMSRPPRRSAASRLWQVAAGVVLVAGLASLPVTLRWMGGERAGGAAPGQPVATGASSADGPTEDSAGATRQPHLALVAPEIVFGGGVSDLSEGALVDLLEELEELEGLPLAEPAPLPTVEPLAADGAQAGAS